jgi:alpha-L-glutamate ligase-like protein
MARTFLLARGRRDLAAAAEVLEREPRIAIKPASASGGEGIVLVRGRSAKGFHVNGHVETRDSLLRHIRRILDGDFNDGMSDTAILEELLETDPALAPLAHEGVPDLRIVCFLGYPVMAMARLPTRQSGGRANLHSGAVGAGISLSTGRITSATWGGIRVDVHPDTGVLLKGFKIPRWREVLEIASASSEASGLGFTGVDVALDARHGPVVMEVNRRPGLEVQNANRAGLLPRLRAIEARGRLAGAPERRVDVAISLDVDGWADVRLPPPDSASPAPATSPGAVNGR